VGWHEHAVNGPPIHGGAKRRALIGLSQLCAVADEVERIDAHEPMPDWVICGSESGSNARAMHPDWAESLRDQCKAAGVAFFMKQMTKRAPIPANLLIREFPQMARRDGPGCRWSWCHG
jgi:hypothetical protein